MHKMISVNYWKVIKNHNNQGNLEETLFSFLISTVSADVLAPNGARTSAGTMMTNLGSFICYFKSALTTADVYTYHFGSQIWVVYSRIQTQDTEPAFDGLMWIPNHQHTWTSELTDS